MEENTLITRLLNMHGAPDHTENVEAFVAEYRSALQSFGPNVLAAAGDRLIRNGGHRWPTVKECLAACLDVQEEEAARAQAREGNAPRKRYPWEENYEHAMKWATEFMAASPLADEARREGWADKLRGYARSHARMTLNASVNLGPPSKWAPPKDVVEDYRRGRV